MVTFTAAPPAAFPERAKGFEEELATLMNGPDLPIARARKAASNGDFAGCARMLVAVPKLGPGELYDLACCQSQAKQVDAAFDSLSRSLSAGFADRKTLQSDPDLANLHTDPRWHELQKN